MFQSYQELPLNKIQIIDTEFTVIVTVPSSSKMYFDAFVEHYQSINQLNICNIMKFLFFYAQDMRRQQFNEKIHQALLNSCTYYQTYADQIQKYLLWT